MTFDLVVRGGTVVTARSRRLAEVAVRDGRIAAVDPALPAGAVASAGRVVDATGMLVLPGVVDAHTHTRIPVDGAPDRFFQDSVAAAFGGTTTFLAFNNPGTGISDASSTRLRAGIEEWLSATRGESAVDVGLSAVITAQQQEPERDIAAAIEAGVTSFKCFLVYDFGVDERRLRDLLPVVGREGGLLEVHGEDRGMLEAGIASQLSAGRTRPRHHADSRPPAVEATGTRRVAAIAAETGAPVYFVHVSSAAAVDEIVAARARGARVLAETCPQYLALDDSHYERPDEEAVRAVISPPLRTRADKEALWVAVADGSLDLVASDHVPDRLAVEKRWRGQPFSEISNGAPGIETLLAVVHGLGPATGRISLERMVDLLSTTPARLFGLPGKGAIEVGRDADLVLLDPAADRTLHAADLHHTSDFTPYEGLRLPGVVRRVILRGDDVVRDGTFLGHRGGGRFVERAIDPDVLAPRAG